MPHRHPVALPATTRPIVLDIPGGPLAGLETLPPTGVPTRGTAVLVPGFSGSKEDFVPLLGALAADGYRVVCYDQRGQYESAGPDNWREYTVASFADDVDAVIRTVGGGRPVHLLGHSFGGVVVQRVAIGHPQSLRSVTLLDTGPGGTSMGMQRAIGPMLLMLKVGGPRLLWWTMRGQLRKAGVAFGQQEWLQYRLLHSRKANLVGIIAALRPEPDRVAELKASKVPALVAYGENDVPWSPATQADMAVRLGARHAVIANAAHTPNEEQPEATAKELLAFWRDIDGVPTGVGAA